MITFKRSQLSALEIRAPKIIWPHISISNLVWPHISLLNLVLLHFIYILYCLRSYALYVFILNILTLGTCTHVLLLIVPHFHLILESISPLVAGLDRRNVCGHLAGNHGLLQVRGLLLVGPVTAHIVLTLPFVLLQEPPGCEAQRDQACNRRDNDARDDPNPAIRGLRNLEARSALHGMLSLAYQTILGLVGAPRAPWAPISAGVAAPWSFILALAVRAASQASLAQPEGVHFCQTGVHAESLLQKFTLRAAQALATSSPAARRACGVTNYARFGVLQLLGTLATPIEAFAVFLPLISLALEAAVLSSLLLVRSKWADAPAVCLLSLLAAGVEAVPLEGGLRAEHRDNWALDFLGKLLSLWEFGIY